MSSSLPTPARDLKKEPERLPLNVILKKAGKRALGGGVPGAIAMATQVVTLMPLRTTMNVRPYLAHCSRCGWSFWVYLRFVSFWRGTLMPCLMTFDECNGPHSHCNPCKVSYVCPRSFVPENSFSISLSQLVSIWRQENALLTIFCCIHAFVTS